MKEVATQMNHERVNMHLTNNQFFNALDCDFKESKDAEKLMQKTGYVRQLFIK